MDAGFEWEENAAISGSKSPGCARTKSSSSFSRSVSSCILVSSSAGGLTYYNYTKLAVVFQVVNREKLSFGFKSTDYCTAREGFS